MDILCDDQIARKYVSKLRATNWVDLLEVGNASGLSSNPNPGNLNSFLMQQDRVFLTADPVFSWPPQNHGTLYFKQKKWPSEQDLVDMIDLIDQRYNPHTKIHQILPGIWQHRI
jgi:hypothetical protein